MVKSMNAAKARFSSARSVAQNARNLGWPSSIVVTPKRYSKPSSKNGSPSMSKNRSPGDGSGNRANPRPVSGVRRS